MDAFSPEFVSHWFADADDDSVARQDERSTAGDDEALAELAERVLAARSIV